MQGIAQNKIRKDALEFGLPALLIPIFLHRIGIEERLLYDHFGEAYLEYQTSTRKLIPFVY